MTDTHLHIDRLRIRVRGVSAEAARAAVSGLGPALLERLLPHVRGGSPGAGPQPADRLDLGVQRAAGSDPSSLRSAISYALAAGLLPYVDGAKGRKGAMR